MSSHPGKVFAPSCPSVINTHYYNLLLTVLESYIISQKKYDKIAILKSSKKTYKGRIYEKNSLAYSLYIAISKLDLLLAMYDFIT